MISSWNSTESAQLAKPLRNVGLDRVFPVRSTVGFCFLVEKNLKLSGNRIRLRLKSGMSTRSEREEIGFLTICSFDDRKRQKVGEED